MSSPQAALAAPLNRPACIRRASARPCGETGPETPNRQGNGLAFIAARSKSAFENRLRRRSRSAFCFQNLRRATPLLPAGVGGDSVISRKSGQLSVQSGPHSLQPPEMNLHSLTEW